MDKPTMNNCPKCGLIQVLHFSTLPACKCQWQKQGEPVAIVVARRYEDGSHAGNQLEWRSRNEANDFPVGTAFYTTPQPQREWVGLTDDEIIEIRLKTFDAIATNYEVYRAIEAKLKEKNT